MAADLRFGDGLSASPTDPRAITRPGGDPLRHRGEPRPVGSIGPITSVGFFYQKSQELICAEPLTAA